MKIPNYSSERFRKVRKSTEFRKVPKNMRTGLASKWCRPLPDRRPPVHEDRVALYSPVLPLRPGCHPERATCHTQAAACKCNKIDMRLKSSTDLLSALCHFPWSPPLSSVQQKCGTATSKCGTQAHAQWAAHAYGCRGGRARHPHTYLTP